MRYAAIASASVLVLGLASTGFAAAPSDEVAKYQGTEFVCTGVGDDAQNNPRWDRFPLKMVFTTSTATTSAT